MLCLLSRFVLCGLALLWLCCDGVRSSTAAPLHFCHFDQISHKDSGKALPTATLVASGAEVLPSSSIIREKKSIVLRFAFSTLDLRNPEKYCDATESKRTDVLGAEIQCNDDNVLTLRKKRQLLQIVRAAAQMHTKRLVSRSSSINGFQVPEFTHEFCRRFTVPAGHREKGVAGADMMLYLSSFPSDKENLYAAGAPCAQLESKRPVAGALTVVTKHIADTVYVVRVLAHEMAHTLGFAYDIMKDIVAMKLKVHETYNDKANVTTLGGNKVLMYAKKRYSCDDITGVELEDEAGELSVPSRSHWERRIALEELMAGVVTAGLYTRLTLAALDDTGFYQARYDSEETMRWGQQAGCDLLKKKCIEGGKTNFPDMFCTDEPSGKKPRCAPGRRGMGYCSGTVEDDALPAQYKYFGDEKKAGAKNLLTDRCPIVTAYDELSCTDATGKSTAEGLRGADSWCLVKCENRDNKDKKCTAIKEGVVCAKVFPESDKPQEIKEQEEQNGNGYDDDDEDFDDEDEQDRKEKILVQLKDGGSDMPCTGSDKIFQSVTSDNANYQCPSHYEVHERRAMRNIASTQSDKDENGRVPSTDTKTISTMPTPTVTSTASITKASTKTVSSTITHTVATNTDTATASDTAAGAQSNTETTSTMPTPTGVNNEGAEHPDGTGHEAGTKPHSDDNTASGTLKGISNNSDKGAEKGTEEAKDIPSSAIPHAVAEKNSTTEDRKNREKAADVPDAKANPAAKKHAEVDDSTEDKMTQPSVTAAAAAPAAWTAVLLLTVMAALFCD